MKADEFAKEYNEVVKRALTLWEKASREGLLAIEDMIDEKSIFKEIFFNLGCDWRWMVRILIILAWFYQVLNIGIEDAMKQYLVDFDNCAE